MKPYYFGLGNQVSSSDTKEKEFEQLMIKDCMTLYLKYTVIQNLM